MRKYEVTIVIQPQLDEEAREQLITRVSDWLAPGAEEAEKPAVNRWGQRRLAYPINKFTEGYYVLYEVDLEPGRVADIERNMRFTEDILRYLFVRTSK